MERGKGGKLKKLILRIGPFQGHISTRRGKGAKLIKCAIKKYKYKTQQGSVKASQALRKREGAAYVPVCPKKIFDM